MVHQSRTNCPSLPRRIGALLACCAGLTLAASLFSGCKGSTSAAAIPERPVASPPNISALFVAADPRISDPLAAGPWAQATWYTLAAPANTSRTTAPARAAILYNASTLYIAFICEQQPAPASHDAVALFLSTSPSSDGKETIKIAVDSTGQTSCSWMHAEAFPERHEASPDLNHTVVTFPDYPIKGLTSQVRQATDHDTQVWTAFVAIPLNNLPKSLLTVAAPGDHWKVNLIRNVTATNAGGERETLQANVSPVYVGAQEFSPQRMADLLLKP